MLVGAVLLFCRGGDEVEDEVEGGFFIFFENGAKVLAPNPRIATLFPGEKFAPTVEPLIYGNLPKPRVGDSA